MEESTKCVSLSTALNNLTKVLEETLTENETLSKREKAAMSTLTIVTGLLQEANENNEAFTEKLQKQQQENDRLKETVCQLRRLMLCPRCTDVLDHCMDGELCDKCTLP